MEREALAIIYWCLNELRNYIGNSGILIETDHKPLVNMHKKKAYGNRRIDNWLIRLQDLIPQISEIKYQRGIDNNGPDYLTRYETIKDDDQQETVAVITRTMMKQVNTSNSEESKIDQQSTTTQPSVHTFDLAKIKEEQDRDVNIQRIISQIQIPKNIQNFIIHNDILFRLIDNRNRKTKHKIPYLPRSMITKVLEAFHDHPMSGHFGVQRTLHKIRERFWWPEMRKTVENYIGSCQQCKKFNIVRSRTPGHLKSYDPPSDVFQVLHMDFEGASMSIFRR
jgi:hypothetical protein